MGGRTVCLLVFKRSVTAWLSYLYRFGGGWRTNKRKTKNAAALGEHWQWMSNPSRSSNFECNLPGKYCPLLDCPVNGNPARTAALFGNVGLRGRVSGGKFIGFARFSALRFALIVCKLWPGFFNGIQWCFAVAKMEF